MIGGYRMISEVFYKVIDNEVCDPKVTGEFYFYYNLIGNGDVFDQGYVDHETKHLSVRDKIIRELIDNGDIPKHPNINATTIFALSSIHNNAILVVNI